MAGVQYHLFGLSLGTGFSFSRNTTDYETSDLKTGSDTYIFLLKVSIYNNLANKIIKLDRWMSSLILTILHKNITTNNNIGALISEDYSCYTYIKINK